MECMNKAGIGTDATMHDHIQKLLDRYYATKDMNTTRFTPTHLGETLVMGYDDMGSSMSRVGYNRSSNYIMVPNLIVIKDIVVTTPPVLLRLVTSGRRTRVDPTRHGTRRGIRGGFAI